MLLLASGSPRRHDLLLQIGVPHTISPADVDESTRPGEAPMDYVLRLAQTKAHTVAQRFPAATVLAADTTVVLSETVLNKPRDLAEARDMLQQLAGRSHHVHTGIAVLHRGKRHTHVETTAVHFTSILEVELATYLATGDSLDKAGAYGIQGYAARWISRIDGDFFNVVGLPLAATVQLLRAAGAI